MPNKFDFIEMTRRLESEGLIPRIRIYLRSSDSLKLRPMGDMPIEHVEDIELYARDAYGSARYSAKLFSTKHGRNILESRYDFGVGLYIEEEEAMQNSMQISMPKFLELLEAMIKSSNPWRI